MSARVAVISIAAVFSAPHGAPTAAAEPAPGREEALRWWRDAKFGMFIHWGPASVRGTEIGWSRAGHPHDHPGNESVPAAEYDSLYKRFDPVKFDAAAWMALAREAGMKYVVFTSKHHDGFSMWHTKLRADYSIAAAPFKRDICRELSDAAHKEGLKLGWYYSTRDWTHPDYLVGDNRKYDDFYVGQVRELLSGYGKIDVMWFDHVAGNWRDYTFERLFRMLEELQPGIVVNDRAARFIRGTEDRPSPAIEALVRGDFDTPEQRIGTFQPDRAWESCVTITECKDGGGWSWRPDGRTRTFEECLRMLVSCVAGDGNLLLNVGPLPTGEILPEQAAVLRKMGRWLAANGRSIYGTRGGPYTNGKWGGSTYRGDKVWIHVLEWPAETLRLRPLGGEVKASRVLAGGEAKVTATGEGLDIEMKAAARDPVDTVIELDLDRPVAGVQRAPALR
jgi:alpha-L-fucosidase